MTLISLASQSLKEVFVSRSVVVSSYVSSVVRSWSHYSRGRCHPVNSILFDEAQRWDSVRMQFRHNAIVILDTDSRRDCDFKFFLEFACDVFARLSPCTSVGSACLTVLWVHHPLSWWVKLSCMFAFLMKLRYIAAGVVVFLCNCVGLVVL